MRKTHIHFSSTHVTCAREQLDVCTHRDMRKVASLQNTTCRCTLGWRVCRDI